MSDLTRARETAILIATALGLPIEVDQRLRELDVGEWSGLTRGEIESRDRDRLLAFEAGDLAVRAGGGESRIELAERAQAFAAEIAVRFPDDHLIVVTHLGILRALAPGFEPENTAFTEILVPITPAPTTEPILRPGKASPL